MSARRVVIVGGGAAGASTAIELRRGGFDGEVVLVCDEPEVPYERPPLSKAFLLEPGVPAHPAFEPADWYAAESVELVLGTAATGLDLAERRVELADGRRLRYDALVVATGVRARRLPGIDGERVHHLRTLAEARVLRDVLAEAEHVAVLGGGVLGCEVAAAARQRGRQVTLLALEEQPLQRIVGTAIGSALAAIHTAAGVELRMSESVTGVAQRGRRVHVESPGGAVMCDALVVCCGSVPNTELLEQAGLECGDGIAVDEHLRTAAPDVYAVGDIASHRHPRYERALRFEHFDTAQRHGRHVAHALLGAGDPFVDAPWFWSDQYDHTLQAIGVIEDPDATILRGTPEDGGVSAIALRDGRIRSVIALDRPRDVLEARRLLFADHAATEAQVRDASTPLKRLARVQRPVGAER